MATHDGPNTVAVGTSDDPACHAARATLWWVVAELLEPSLQAVDVAALRAMLDAAPPPAALQEIWGDLRSALVAIQLGDRREPERVLQCARELRVVARVEDARAFHVGVAEARTDSAAAERIMRQWRDFLDGPGAGHIEAAAAALATADSAARQLIGRALLRLLAISVNTDSSGVTRWAIGSAEQGDLRSPEAA
ncbi:MAG: hypothetical protein IT379_13130 [Deltaproteobacteria bacterium]|nr:hypothetical protein [Deltaproteobacteria bacterium]